MKLKRSALASRTILVAVVLSLAPAVALAQASAENVAAARALGIEGIRLADAGNCAAAIEKLERAEALYHAPTTLTRLGECQVAVGKIVLGTENLNRAVRETLPANAPRAFTDAQQRARRALDAALPKIAQLTVSVQPASAQPTVTVDGAPVPSVLLGASRPTDPGKHEIQATAPGYLQEAQTVTLQEGGSAEVTLTLRPDPNASAAPSPGAEGPGSPTPVDAVPANSSPTASPTQDAGVSSGTSKVPAYVLLGVGAAGLALGSVTGLLAMSKEGDLEDLCPQDGRCPRGEPTETLESARTLATVSTIGFGVGLASAAVGAVLLFTGSNSGSARSTPAPSLAVDRFTARPWVSLGSAGVSGSF
jgi:hypothetical protein